MISIKETSPGRRAIVIRSGEHVDEMIIDVPDAASIGRPFIQLGSRRVIDGDLVNNFCEALLRTAEKWFADNWPSKAYVFSDKVYMFPGEEWAGKKKEEP